MASPDTDVMQIPPLLLDRSRDEPLTMQLAGQLRDAIRQGRIPVGARLPSSRRLSEQLYIGRNTVVRAYETLTMEGFVEARSASGVFATSPPSAGPMALGAATHGTAAADALPEMPRPRHPAGVSAPAEPNRHRLNFDFLPGTPRANLFPVKTWRRLLQACLSYGGSAGLTQAGDPGGLPVLRTAIATHLAFSRGVVVDPAQVLIVTGVQEGLHIAARLFVSPGSRVIVEDPCFRGAAQAFEAAGAHLHSVPVDDHGLQTGGLPEGSSALLYLTSSHQFPRGHVLSLNRRHELIKWARRHGCYLLEDDCGSDFHYDGSALPAVASLAPDCCLYLGSFSMSLGAGLRIGYLVVPPGLIDAVRDARVLLGNGNSWLDQAALADYMRSGSFAAHLTRCRVEYKASRDALTSALRRHFGDVRLSGEQSGLHLFWQLPAGVPEAARLEELARQRRVGIQALSSARVHWSPASETLARRSVLLGYATMQPAQIEQAVARLSDAVDDTLDLQPGFVEELLRQAPPPREPAAPSLDQHGRRPTRPVPRILQQPALRTVMSRKAKSRDDTAEENESCMRLVRAIYRYPVKGLSPQPVTGIELEAGKPFPFDRVFALARPGAPVDVTEPAWAKKGLFVMLMLDETLAQVQTRLDVHTLRFEVVRGTERVLDADLNTGSGRAEVERFFQGLVPQLAAPPRLLQSAAGHFMDKPDNVVSLINLATVRSLEAQWDRVIDPLRFRANFYVDGLRPWEEFDWIGSDILLGDALLRVDRRNGRCGATNVNPATGQRDMDIPRSLRNDFGHKDLGIYLIVRKPGKVVVGDTVTVPRFEPAPAGADDVEAGLPVASNAATAEPGSRRYICRGCYFIYDESLGFAPGLLAPGTAFSAIAPGWRCPDCGVDRSMFRPHVAEPLGTTGR